MKAFLSYRRRSGRRGMVLLEVVAALAIFVLVAFALVKALDASLDVAMERNQIESAMQGLENQRALLHGSRLVPSDEDLPDDASGISYHLSIKPELLLDQNKKTLPNMYRATITAKWKVSGRQEDRSVTELIYQP